MKARAREIVPRPSPVRPARQARAGPVRLEHEAVEQAARAIVDRRMGHRPVHPVAPVALVQRCQRLTRAGRRVTTVLPCSHTSVAIDQTQA